MKKRIFRDQKEKVFLKFCGSVVSAQQEMSGAKYLAPAVLVPKIEMLDTRTLLIYEMVGIKASKVPNSLLNSQLLGYFSRVEPVSAFENGQTIFDQIERVSRQFLLPRGMVEKISHRPLFPVHGDLQKQNILLVDGQLALIDFEHFVFAPLELELVNSLFFSDGNCLDLGSLLPVLKKSGRINFEILQLMLLFYSLRQVMAGRAFIEAKRRYLFGLVRLQTILGQDLSGEPLVFPQKPAVVSFLSASTCRA